MINRISGNILLLSTLIFNGFCYCTSPTYKVKVKCRYMAYACGECEPKHRIDTVLKVVEGKLDKRKVVDQDVKVIFRSSEQERRIDSQVQKCAICYDFYIDGDLKFLSLKGYYTLDVDTCIVKLRFKHCCDE